MFKSSKISKAESNAQLPRVSFYFEVLWEVVKHKHRPACAHSGFIQAWFGMPPIATILNYVVTENLLFLSENNKSKFNVVILNVV